MDLATCAQSYHLGLHDRLVAEKELDLHHLHPPFDHDLVDILV